MGKKFILIGTKKSKRFNSVKVVSSRTSDSKLKKIISLLPKSVRFKVVSEKNLVKFLDSRLNILRIPSKTKK